MMYQKICCERKTFTPQIIAKTLYNISINQYGFIHIDNNTTIFYDNLRFNLLCYDVPDLQNGYSIFPITYSVEWLFIQKILNHLDHKIISNVRYTMYSYSSKMLLLIDTALSLPVNDDIKCIIISNIFINPEVPICLYTVINHKWAPFCKKFGKTCDHLVK